MNKGLWNENIVHDDSLEILSKELEELENDELSVREAGFLQGYDEVESYGFFGVAE